MGKKQMELNTRGNYIKVFLIVSSFLYGILGCIALGIGLFLSSDQLSFVTEVFVTPLLTVSSGLIVSAGILVFLFSIVGCFGTFLRSTSAILAFVVGLCVIYLLAVGGVTAAIVFRSWVTEQLRSHMNEIITQKYGINLTEPGHKEITQSWDMAQEKWYCCGIDDSGWRIYRGSKWFQEQPGLHEADKPLVPPSCCRKDQYGKYYSLQRCQTWTSGPPHIQTSFVKNEALFYKGCYERGNDALYGISLFLILIGLVIALITIAIIILSLFYAKMLP